LGVVLIGLDRQEKGQGELSAIQEIEASYAVPVVSIVKLEHVLQYMQGQNEPHLVEAIESYRKNFGV
jgi:orotate phosphoribosyltransferase